MEALAVAVLGGLVLLAVAARLVTALARSLADTARRTGRTAASAGGTVGVRGLLTVLAGAGTALASAPSASAAPTPISAPVSAPATAAASPAPRPAAAPTTYVVRPGDSLWAIAARHLGPGASNAEIAAEWPRWYRANREVIGSNPSLLYVGTRLAVPHGRRTGTSASPHSTPAPSGPDRTALSLDPDRR